LFIIISNWTISQVHSVSESTDGISPLSQEGQSPAFKRGHYPKLRYAMIPFHEVCLRKYIIAVIAVAFCIANIEIGRTQESAQHIFAAGGDVKESVPLLEEMVSALRIDAAYPHVFGTKSPGEKDLVVTPVHLSDSGAQEYFVIGRKGLPGLAEDRVIFWIMRQKKNGYEVLNNFGGQELEIKANQTNGYHDLELRSTSPEIGKFITTLKYDDRTQTYKATGASLEPESPTPAVKP